MRYLLCLLFFVATPMFAWNSVGHRIIAQIAYDQLSPAVKEKVDAITAQQFYSTYPETRFLKAAVWRDQIKHKTTQYNTWHYINLRDTRQSQNVVWAILHAENIIENKTTSPARRAKYLSFLIHFVGDIHQPLHCATLYNSQFPRGDRGGNDYPVESTMAPNLHVLWDSGLGLLVDWKVEKIASRWTAEYPKSFFGARLQVNAPMQWALESHQIAVDFAYTLPPYGVPSQQYVQRGQAIVRQQIVLAGYRLAALLNQILT